MTGRAILIMSGGTGGHVFPALAVAEYLAEREVSLLWLGTRLGLEARLVPQAGYPFFTISVAGIRGKGIGRWAIAPFQTLWAFFQSVLLLLKNRPSAVLGMGGFVSGPGGVAAWLMRIPLLIHEQNAIMGTTNRVLSPIATRVMEAFPGTFPEARAAIRTGNPIRRCFSRIDPPDESPPADPRQLRLLVLGGSQGARALNHGVPLACARLDHQGLVVRHQSGERDLETTRQQYAKQKISAQVAPFLDEMASVYAWADLVVCRAGAMTISELAAAGVASVLVPYPYAIDDHQTANAQYLARSGAAVLVPEARIDPDRLAKTIKELWEDRGRLMKMARRARELAVFDAAQRVGDLCMEAARG